MTANVCKKITAQLTGAVGKQEDVSVQLEALDILSDMLSRYQGSRGSGLWRGCIYLFAFDFSVSLILLQGLKPEGSGLAAPGNISAGMRGGALSPRCWWWIPRRLRSRRCGEGEGKAGKFILAPRSDHTCIFSPAAFFSRYISRSDSVMCQLCAGSY